jgi:hypothetical protein
MDFGFLKVKPLTRLAFASFNRDLRPTAANAGAPAVRAA